MIDEFTLSECMNNRDILMLKISNLEFAISQSEQIIKESNIDIESLTFLRRRVAQSKSDLEVLYLIKNKQSL